MNHFFLIDDSHAARAYVLYVFNLYVNKRQVRYIYVIRASQVVRLSYGFLERSASAAYVLRSRK